MAETASNADQPKARRPWHQFSLRTLLIVVSLLSLPCAYVAHEYRIVRERKALAETPGTEPSWHVGRPESNKISWFRKWLGDYEFEEITVNDSTTTNDLIDRYRAAFPEAEITRIRNGKIDRFFGGPEP